MRKPVRTSSRISRAPCSRVIRDRPGVEALARGDHAHVGRRGLGDDGGNAVAVLGEGGFDGVEVVVGQHERLGGGRGGDAGRAGQREGRQAGACGGEEAVEVAVVAAGELDDEVRGR